MSHSVQHLMYVRNVGKCWVGKNLKGNSVLMIGVTIPEIVYKH